MYTTKYGVLKKGLYYRDNFAALTVLGVLFNIKFQNVEGELYEVDETRLKIFDELENHPRMYERRDVVVTPNIEEQNSTLNIKAQAYFLVKYRPHLLELPMLQSYADLIDGKKYFLPKDRDIPVPLWWYEVHTGYEKDQ